MIVFFSGTGNSRYCADILGKRLGDTVVDAAPYLRRGEGAELASERPWVFVCPTYAWKIPRVFEGFLRNSRFSGHRQAYFVMTCGGEIGAAAAELEPLCTAMGLQYQGVFPVKMADNYLILFPAPKDEEIRRGLQNARVCMEQAAQTIAAQTAAPAVSWGWLDRLKSGPVNQGMYRFYIKPKKFRVTDGCTGCGACQHRCPLNNIHLVDGKPQWGPDCTHCMACLCGCPAGAMEYGRATVGKARYLCPSAGKGTEG